MFPIRFLYSMGIGGAIVALCDGAVALIVLPAVLIVLGPRINALAPAWLQRRAASSATAAAGQNGGWWRLARGVVRRPAPVAVISAIVLLAAAIPALRLQFTSPGANLLPASRGKPSGRNGVREELPRQRGRSDRNRVEGDALIGAATRRRARPGLQAGWRASRPRSISVAAHGRSLLLPHGSPYSDVQQRLLARLRALAHPYGALVGGATAFFADQKTAIAAHIPLALADPAGAHRRLPVPDDGLGDDPDQGDRDEHAQRERRRRTAGADLPGRPLLRPARVHAARRTWKSRASC